jgi:hypothetical protein
MYGATRWQVVPRTDRVCRVGEMHVDAFSLLEERVMNPYLMLGSALGTIEATSLSARLLAWHDAMVAHERRLRAGRTRVVCDDECPHAESRALWSEAVATFGSRAHELTLLRSRAKEFARRSKAGCGEMGTNVGSC